MGFLWVLWFLSTVLKSPLGVRVKMYGVQHVCVPCDLPFVCFGGTRQTPPQLGWVQSEPDDGWIIVLLFG